MRTWPATAALAALLLMSGGADAEQLQGEEITETIQGKRVYLAVPLGGEFPLVYRDDGQVEGSGEGVGLGRYMQPTDSGRWWVQNDMLCQQWEEWYDGRRFCFSLVKDSPDTLRWTRDDGYSGTARVEN